MEDSNQTSNSIRVAIAGATGYIGGRLAPRLLEAGYAVCCLVRAPDKLRDRTWSAAPGVTVRKTALEDLGSVTQSLTGCNVAYYLVHSMMSAGSGYAERDLELANTFAAGAKAAGVERIIYLGGLGDDTAGLSKHLSSRREVEKALRSGGVPVTVFRAAMIIGSGSASFEILRYLVERLPVMVTPKWVATPCQPIAVRNVLGYLVGALKVPATSGETYEIGGPEVRRYDEIMQLMAEERGLGRRWIIPVPVLTPRLSSYWIQLVTPLSHSIAKPLAEGLKNPVVCHEFRIRELIPQQLLTIREAIHAALSRMAEHQVETTWSMAGTIPGDPDWAGGTVFTDERTKTIGAPDWAVFRAICRVGGYNGWYAANTLWRLRGAIDLLFGGPGLRRGRRDQEVVGYGEALDFWRVVGFENNRRLSLRAEMKLPGDAVLDFEVQPSADGNCTLKQRARFKPRGLWGLVYWYAVLPFHSIVFAGMLAGIERKAMEIAHQRPIAEVPKTV